MRYLSLLIPVLVALLAPHAAHHRRPTPARTRSDRVRPYAPPTPATEPPPAYEVETQADMVRPYVLDENHCARRRAERREAAQERADRNRLGVAVLWDVAETQQRELAGVAS